MRVSNKGIPAEPQQFHTINSERLDSKEHDMQGDVSLARCFAMDLKTVPGDVGPPP
jgi:hypothetical protein